MRGEVVQHAHLARYAPARWLGHRQAHLHGEFFRDIRPVNTIMQIDCFIDPEWLIGD